MITVHTLLLLLLLLQVVIRHGARAPYAKLPCWSNYSAVWDCDVSAAQATGSTAALQLTQRLLSADTAKLSELGQLLCSTDFMM